MSLPEVLPLVILRGSGETTAQLARDTTCERILASLPSEKSGYRS